MNDEKSNLINVTLPDLDGVIPSLRAGDGVLLSGEIYTLRDAGHKRLIESIRRGKPDFDVRGKAIYYCGPTPALPGEVIGSCGPTTSTRMDDYAPALYDLGLLATIGKGKRSEAVIASIVKNRAVYLVAVGGAAALYKSCVTANEPVLYDDLGCEALRRLTVKDMPLLVAVDSLGNDILK